MGRARLRWMNEHYRVLLLWTTSRYETFIDKPEDNQAKKGYSVLYYHLGLDTLYIFMCVPVLVVQVAVVLGIISPLLLLLVY
jgi:hypothetical protein